MFKSLYIKRIVAAAILIIFAFSITPAIVFHNLVAGHTDTAKKCTDTKEQVGKQTFNCHCNNIVAESPFTEPAPVIIAVAEQFFSLVKFEKTQSLSNSPKNFTSLRGPPVV